MQERSADESVWHHQANPVRVYSEDKIQRDRINRSVECALDAMRNTGPQIPKSIIELGCGTGDICGALAEKIPQCAVIGVDCNSLDLGEAIKRHPSLQTVCGPIESAQRELYATCTFGLCILCEVLEHLDDPLSAAEFWLSRSHLSVISHPLDESPKSELSGGDHSWSLSVDDHRDFFKAGGHVVDHSEIFLMGAYHIILSRGHKQ
jgi:SAM-dependent methyltransferase